MRFLLRLLINAAALWVAVRIVHGITYSSDDWVPFFVVALIFGVVNGLMLLLTSALSGALGLHFHVEGCWTAILGALVVSIVSALLSMFLADPA